MNIHSQIPQQKQSAYLPQRSPDEARNEALPFHEMNSTQVDCGYADALTIRFNFF